MATTFLAAVVDTLLPGGSLANGVVAPPASGLDIQWTLLSGRHAGILAAIAANAGGEERLASGTEDFRTDVMKRIETSHPQDFAGLAMTVLTLYYEHPRVLAAFGWPAHPPQPLGHELPPLDETLLAPVKRRGEIWRKP